MASEHFTFTLPRLKALEPQGKAYYVRDDTISGLQVKITPAGKKVFIVRRRAKGNPKVLTITLGNLGDGLPIKQIRAHAVDVIGQLNRGINPNIERRAVAEEVELTSVTLVQAFETYIDGTRNQRTGKRLSTAVRHNYPLIFKRDFKDWLPKPMVSIKAVALIGRYDQIELNHGKSAAAKAMNIFRATWTFMNKLQRTDDEAEPFGKCPLWKLTDLRPGWHKSAPRTRKVSVDELPVWLAAVREDDSVGSLYFEALLLTGVRRREIAGLKWSEVDLKKKTITFLNTKNGSDHVLPITRRMVELLRDSKRKYPHLAKPFRMIDPTRTMARVTEKTGVKFSSHDIRRTFAVLADKSGAGSFAIKAILNHSAGKDVTAGHYVQYSDVDDLREPLQAIEDYILCVGHGHGHGHRGNVLQVVK